MVVAAALVVAAHAYAAPTPSIRPNLSGTVKVGEQLTGDTGTWAGSGSLSYAYQWYRCNAAGAKCKAIRGATAETYALTDDDAGSTIGLTVKATDTSGMANAYSSLAGPIAKGTLYATGAPKVKGDAAVGRHLAVDAGAWDVTPQSVAYQWLRCNGNGRICAPIAGATAAHYKPVAADVAHALVARVTAKVGSTTQPAMSAATPAVISEADTLPQGATPLGKGRYSVPVESVALPARLIVTRVHTKGDALNVAVADTRGYAIRGALVHVTAPYGWVAPLVETATGEDGTLTLHLKPKAGHPKRIVLYVRVRKPGDKVLAGVTGTRLVSVAA